MDSKKSAKLSLVFLILTFVLGNILTFIYWLGRCLMAIHDVAMADLPFFLPYFLLLLFALFTITPLFFSWYYAKKSEIKGLTMISKILFILFATICSLIFSLGLLFSILGIV